MNMTRQQRRAAERNEKKPDIWQPFREIAQGGFEIQGGSSYMVSRFGLSEADAHAEAIKVFAGSKFFVNGTYEVALKAAPQDGWLHLLIRRSDGAPVTSWRDKQRIKDELVGPEHEGIELFPAQSRMVDLANAYHLWVQADPTDRLEIGFHDGRHVA